MRATSTETQAARARRAGYRLDDQIGFVLRRAYQRASANLARRIGSYDLTAPQFAVLARLYERGALSQNRLGRLVAMEPANIHVIVKRLSLRGLVITERAPDDARLVLARLTREGAALAERLIPLEIDAGAATLASLSATERRELLRLLDRVLDGDAAQA
ncbi:MAG: MarR family transcriptional regulator [Burkholderiaceae bacterium]|nr:MarR family transcriptional regulator [Burkholderiaceae bacterium]